MILLLILLPLYLWPLRGGLGALPGSSVLPGAARDPRSAAALAQIPGDVWDALMGHTHAPPPSPPPAKPPRNLTMIVPPGGIPGGDPDEAAGDAAFPDDPSALARGMLAQLGSSGPGGADTPSQPEEFVGTPGDGTGIGSAPSGFAPGGHPGLGNLGPFPGGGGPGGGPRLPGLALTLDPAEPGDLAPTPEPATLLLVGSNLALLGGAVWRRRRRRLGIPPIG